MAKDAKGEIQVFKEIIETLLQANGIVITLDIEKEIIEILQREQDKFDKQLSQKGIPENLEAFFKFSKKKDIVSYSKRALISEDELFLLIHNCSQIGFTHKSKFPQFVPKEREILDSDLAELKKSDPRKIGNKIERIFEERKNYMVHLFEKDKEWHCFYYTYKDMETGEKNHWRHGPHLHYVSYLWPYLKKRQVWESFEKRNIDLQGIHIRLKPHQTPDKHYKLELPSGMLNRFKRTNREDDSGSI